MPSLSRVAVALLVVGAVLLASPAYADAVVPSENRSSRILDARQLGEDWDGEPRNETKDLVDTYEQEHVLNVQRYAALGARGSTDHLLCNDAVNRTVAVMREATRRGNATTTDAETAAALRCMADRWDYYRGPEDERHDIRGFNVSSEDGTTRVETRAAGDEEVAAHVRERELVSYDAMNASMQRAVDDVLNESSEEEYGGYRPPADHPILERTPLLVKKDGTTYVVATIGHVDDFNVAALLFVLGTMAVGAICVVAGLGVGGYALYGRYTSE